MLGKMMREPLLVSSLIAHAARQHKIVPPIVGQCCCGDSTPWSLIRRFRLEHLVACRQTLGIEFEVHAGGQEHYPYVLSLE